ncbi:MAG: hypothetical protein J6P16_01115 [Eubacterium sp.]|nr:hypothetical protein [Eubacterium sp.]
MNTCMIKNISHKIVAFGIFVIAVLASVILISSGAAAVAGADVSAPARAEQEPAAVSDQAAELNTISRDVRLHNKDNIQPVDYDREFFHVGDHGYLTFAREDAGEDLAGAPSDVREKLLNISSTDDYADVAISYSVDDETLISVDEKEHTYTVLAGGEATVILSAKIKKEDALSPTGYTEETWLAKFTFIIMGDTSMTRPETGKVTSYMVYETIGAADVELKDCPDLKYYSFDYVSSNSSMLVDVTLDPISKMLHIQSYVEGTSVITVRLNGNPITITYINKLTGISEDHHVMDVGDSFSLSVKKYKGKIKWRSSRPSVAKVDDDGYVVSGKVGNTIIYALIPGNYGMQRIGCAVSVVKKGYSDVLDTAIRIGRTCSYSQPNRMSKGYYDCSSLVWRAYKKLGKYFGRKKWAPTAAEECRWCAGKKRVLGAWEYENIENMDYLPTDVLFRTGASNGRYLGIYHIEMFAGYRVIGFDEKKPILAMCWANRPDDYYEPCGDLFARP